MEKSPFAYRVPMIGFLLAVFFALTVCNGSAEEKFPLAPQWQLEDITGHTVKLSDYKGKVVILSFWATWCAPCRREIPGFVELQKKYGPQGLAIVGISLDEGSPEVLTRFVHEMGMNYPTLRATEAVVFLYGGIQYIPTTFVINREGRVVAQYGGEADQATFEKTVKPLL